MQQLLIKAIVDELRTTVTDHYLGKIFQLTPLSFALDLGLKGRFLFISVEPSSPRLYLIERRMKDLEKISMQLSLFGQSLRAKLGGCLLVNVTQDPKERVVRFTSRLDDDLGLTHFRRLVVQLTGRSANLFILDELNRVSSALRYPKGTGQQIGEPYRPPVTLPGAQLAESAPFTSNAPSAATDAYYTAVEEQKAFASLANSARSRLRKSVQQKQRLKQNLESDLALHGDASKHKRIGDLILANIATAIRNGNSVKITDYYADDSPTIELEIDENSSLQNEAARRFRLYTKAKTASEEIAGRLATLAAEIVHLEHQQAELEQIIAQKNVTALQAIAGVKSAVISRQTRAKQPESIPGVRRYLSTDGYEILVGRAARDNDNLTFRVARPHDLWMHAGDYPGSHVVIRNPTRKEIPQRTIIEAAQLAARFSQASDDSKVVIHYAERKFLAKPKGAAPGLVRMSSFRSITVEPKETIKRL